MSGHPPGKNPASHGNIFSRFFYAVIPDALKETLQPGSEDFIRVRALSSMLVIMVIISICCTVLIAGIHLFSDLNLAVLAWTCLIILLVMLAQLLLYYKTCDYRSSAIFLSLSYFIIIVMLMVLSGGYQSPMQAMLLTTPMVAFLLGGRQDGIQNTIFVSIIVLGMIAADYHHIALLSLFGTDALHLMSAVCWLVTLSISMSCLVVYDYALETQNH